MANVYDEITTDITKNKKQTQKDIKNLATEKQNILNTYDTNYNQQMTDYNDLMNQQQNTINTWAETQKQNQQKQTDFELGLIEQQKKEAQQQTNAEIGNAYIDYQKGLNQFGGSAETLASQGLGGTGFAKNQDIAMNITYQNRVSTAKSALLKANTEYDNQMQQARLNNDARLAEIAYQQLKESTQLALQGFEYKSKLMNERINFIQNTNDSYFNKQNTLQSRLDTYNTNLNNIKLAKYNDQQSNLVSSGGSGSSSSSKKSSGTTKKSTNSSKTTTNFTDTKKNTSSSKSTGNAGVIGLAASVMSQVNGNRPNNVNGNKTTDTGYKIDNKAVYRAGDKYYVWDTSQKKYVDVSKVVGNTLDTLSKTLGKSIYSLQK